MSVDMMRWIIMKCPFCGWNESKVVDSRPAEDYVVIRRRRECEKCSKRFTTYEKVEEIPLVIVKRDGRREAFQREKVINGLIRACQKRPISLQEIEKIASHVEKELYNTMEKEIDSKKIGAMVMNKLRKLDDVAYVRFASVYKEFKDINTFMEELNKLMNDREV